MIISYATLLCVIVEEMVRNLRGTFLLSALCRDPRSQ